MKPTEKQLAFANKIAERLNMDIPDKSTAKSVSDFINTHKKSFYKAENQDIKQRIREEFKIPDVARELGLTVEKKGRYFSLKEYDSVRIVPEGDYFFRNSAPGARGSIGYGDTVIGFVSMFTGKSEVEVIQDFKQRLGGEFQFSTAIEKPKTNQEPVKKEFELPPADDNMRRVFAYLTKSRYIDPEVVQNFVNSKQLYQDRRGNCVFVGYNAEQKPVFGCMRGTNTAHRFVGDCIGNDYESGIYLNYGRNDLLVFEAPIDAMSYMTILNAKGEKISDHNYLIMGGAEKVEAVLKHVKEGQIDSVIMAVDNDMGGRKSIERVGKLLQEEIEGVSLLECIPEQANDWNEELSYALKNGIRFRDIEINMIPSDYKKSLEIENEIQGSYTQKICRQMSEKYMQMGFDFSKANDMGIGIGD